MNIHEYQAKEILSEFGINIPRGGLAYSPEQAVYRANEIGGGSWFVKAQIHSGGRGEAGGIKLCKTDNEILAVAQALLGERLITRQTGSAGRVVHRLYIEAENEVLSEYCLGFILDRRMEQVVVVASRGGGMDIHEILEEKPVSIIRIAVEPAVGMQSFQAREIAFKLGIDKSMLTQSVTAILGCYRAFRDLDATMIEINPLAITKDGHLMALDAKMGFDDSALFRHQRISDFRDRTQENPLAMKAIDLGISYVPMDGNIGCIVNGAGLAMATIDMIKLADGWPANFLDIGSGALPDRVIQAINLVLLDDKVEVILINIFAGTNRCDWIAEGLVKAVRKKSIKIPIIARLAGTNAKKGKHIISECGLPIITADSLRDAADKAVAAWRGHTGQ